MNILFTSHNFTLYSYLSCVADDNNVHVFHNRSIPRTNFDDRIFIHKYHDWIFESTRFLNSQISTPNSIPNFKRECRRINPQIIINTDFFKISFLKSVRYKNQYPDVRLILWCETQRWSQSFFTRWVMKLFWFYLNLNLKQVEKIFVFTEQGRVFFESRLKGTMPVVLMPAPVDVEKFVPNKKKVFIKEGVLRIIMNARYVTFKRHDDLLQALVQLREQGRRFHLTCIGRDMNGRAQVECRIKALGLTENVTFLDPVSQDKLPSIYHQHDVLVLPSHNEAIGMVVPEAMACGIPTITSNTVGANVYVDEGVTGYIFETGNVADLTDKIMNMYDAHKLEVMGAAARAQVEKFTIKNLGPQFEHAILSSRE